jgi:hypothetical protein
VLGESLHPVGQAAGFSATNRTFRPCATSAAIRLAMVWLLPVPGGP